MAVSYYLYLQLKFYELTKPLQKQCDDLQRKVSQLNQQVAIKEEKLITSEEVTLLSYYTVCHHHHHIIILLCVGCC